jgi:hypothetical protein
LNSIGILSQNFGGKVFSLLQIFSKHPQSLADGPDASMLTDQTLPCNGILWTGLAAEEKNAMQAICRILHGKKKEMDASTERFPEIQVLARSCLKTASVTVSGKAPGYPSFSTCQ